MRASGATRTSSSTSTDSSFWKEHSITSARVVALHRLRQHLGDVITRPVSSTGVELLRSTTRARCGPRSRGTSRRRRGASRRGEDPQQRLVELPVRDLLDARRRRSCGFSPRRPPMRMSIASTNSPSTFLSTPSMPTSAIWCCAQLDEQPAKCRRKSSPWPFGRTCSSRNLAISTARLLGVDLGQAAELLAGAGLQAARGRASGWGVSSCDQRLGEQRVDVARSGSTAAGRSAGGSGAARRRVGRRTCGRARTSSNSWSAFRRPTGTTKPTVRCAPSACGVDADVVLAATGPGPSGRRGAAARPTRRSSSSRSASGPDAVDEELQARLAARLPVLLGVAEDRGHRRRRPRGPPRA